MLDAAKAKELSLEHGDRTQGNIQEIDQAIQEHCILGFQNANLSIPMNVAGAMVQDLINRGFKVYANINPHREFCEVDVEW